MPASIQGYDRNYKCSLQFHHSRTDAFQFERRSVLRHSKHAGTTPRPELHRLRRLNKHAKNTQFDSLRMSAAFFLASC